MVFDDYVCLQSVKSAEIHKLAVPTSNFISLQIILELLNQFLLIQTIYYYRHIDKLTMDNRYQLQVHSHGNLASIKIFEIVNCLCCFIFRSSIFTMLPKLAPCSNHIENRFIVIDEHEILDCFILIDQTLSNITEMFISIIL